MRFLETIPSLPALEPLAASTIRSTALIAFAALVALGLRRAPAARRHVVWTLALLGCVVMPVASRVVPGWSLSLLPAWNVATEPVIASPSDPGPAAITPASPAPPPQQSAPEPVSVSRTANPAPAAPAVWRLSRADVLRLLPFVWLAGVVLLLGRSLRGWAVLSRVTRRATPMTDHAWQVALARHGTHLGLPWLPGLRVSSEITVPVVCGALRPTILLPADATAWSDERRDAVLLHELAHVGRRDLIAARVTQLASLLYWFNPAVWLAARAQRAEAERACDDQVLEAGGRASAYATDLLEIARGAGGRERLDAAALAMARRSQLEGRLLAILDPHVPRGKAGRVAVTLSVLVAAAGIGALAAARPAQSKATPLPATSTVRDAGQTPSESIAAARSAQASRSDQATPGAAADAASDAAAASATRPSVPPAPPAPPAPSSPTGGGVHVDAQLAAGSSHWSITGLGLGEMRSGSWNNRNSRGSFKSRGTVKYSAGLDDIVSISSGGFVEIEDRRDRKLHKATFEGRRGGIERSYSIDGDERPWDDAARAWMAEFLIDLDHGSGMFVEHRFPRLMNEGGPARVLREVSDMTSDYGRGLYFRKLLASDVDDATMRSLVSQAGREITSDYELAQTLIDAAERNALADDATRGAYLGAINTLQSDYEHGRVLQVLVSRRDLSDAQVRDAIESAAQMQSDYERAQVMIALAERGHVKPARQPAYLRGTGSLSSDYERGRVLQALLQKGLAPENLGEMLAASAKFSSDYERANVLEQLAAAVPLDDAGRDAFLEATKAFSSDHDRNRALAALARARRR